MDMDDDDDAISDEQSDNELAENLVQETDEGFEEATIFARTGFDQYFTLNSKLSKTSANVFSDKIPPLTPQEYTEAIRSSSARSLLVPWLQTARRQLFPRLVTQLDEGFNLLMYGAGSKREILNALAVHMSGKKRDVFVVNGFNPSSSLKDLLTAIENMPALQTYPSTSGSGIEAQTRRVQRFFSSNDDDSPIYVVIHNLDAPSFRNAKSQSCLALLAACPRIHIVASADNIAFPHLWSFTDIFSRKSAALNADVASSGGFAWLFHDLTTLAPYDFELAYADRSSIKGASQAKLSRSQKEIAGTSPTALMTETAARHVLASVTAKAKKLFVLLGTKQLELMEETSAAPTDLQQLAFSYSMLFNIAREDFIATNDTVLRALMGEFKDHGLMVTVMQSGGGNEAVWVPLRKDALVKIVRDMKQE